MPSQPPRLPSITEAAEPLPCSSGDVYNLIAADELSAVAFTASGALPNLRRLP